MQTHTLRRALATALLLVTTQACSFSISTANLSALKLGKSQGAAQQASSFGPDDKIYAVATVSNAGGDVKVRGRLVVVDVAVEKAGPIQSTEATVNLEGGGDAAFTLSPPPDGWPAGKYRFEAVMLDDKGAQKDQKTADFSVS